MSCNVFSSGIAGIQPTGCESHLYVVYMSVELISRMETVVSSNIFFPSSHVFDDAKNFLSSLPFTD